jgi:hypothetical protein
MKQQNRCHASGTRNGDHFCISAEGQVLYGVLVAATSVGTIEGAASMMTVLVPVRPRGFRAAGFTDLRSWRVARQD